MKRICPHLLLVLLAFATHASGAKADIYKCPSGTKPVGNPPPKGLAIGCEAEESKKKGPFTSWYDEGHVKQTGYYRDNLAHGTFIEYYPNGQKKSEGDFDNGKLDG